MKAIILVDMQNDFSDIGSLPIEGTINLAKKINEFISKLDNKEYKIIASQDWHHFKHFSFVQYPVHCVYFSKGSKLISPLDEFKFDLIVKKGTYRKIENFSPFYNGKRKTKLNSFLNKNNIKEVYVIGVAKDICVKETIMDLIKFNFTPILIDDLSLGIQKDFVLEVKGLKKINLKDM